MKPGIILRLLMVLAAVSCKKEKPLDVKPVEPERYLTVILNPDYLPAAKIDSATISWNNADKTESVKLTVRGNDLVTGFSKLPLTERRYELLLFTSQKLGTTALLWQKEFTVALSERNALNIVAPLSINDANWKPGVIMKDGAGLLAFSGIRADDPYFHICRIDKGWKKIAVDRSHWNTIGGRTKVGGAVWRGENVLDANGSYRDSSFFSILPGQIGNNRWNQVEIVMLFTSSSGIQKKTLSFIHAFDK